MKGWENGTEREREQGGPRFIALSTTANNTRKKTTAHFIPQNTKQHMAIYTTREQQNSSFTKLADFKRYFSDTLSS